MWPVFPYSANMLDKFIISPLYPLTYCWLIICFAACLLTLKVPMTLIFRILIKFYDDPTCLSSEIVIVGMKTPALLTTTSILPYFFTVNSISSITFFSSVTSTLKNGELVYEAILLPIFWSMSAITTWASIDLRRRTVAKPNPEAPPVTITIRFLSIFIFNNKSRFIG